MNNIGKQNPGDRRREIRTPAQRKAEQERKLLMEKRIREQIIAEERQKVSHLANDGRSDPRIINNTGRQNPADYRRDIRTPAQRKAEQEQKLLAEKRIREQRIAEERQKATRTVNGTRSDPRHTTPQAHGAPASASRVPENRSPAKNSYEQKLMDQQKQIEMLQRQIQFEKEQRNHATEEQIRIRELERELDHQLAIREKYLSADERPYTGTSPALLTGPWKYAPIIAIAILTVVTIVAFSSITKKSIPAKNSDAPQVLAEDNNTSQVSQQSNSVAVSVDVNREKASVVSADSVNGTLILVNGNHPFNFDHAGTDITDDTRIAVAGKIPDNTYKAADYNVLLNTETVDNLNLMMKDFYAYSKKNDVMINSAYRTFEDQQKILDSKRQSLGDDQQIAQTPGNSEHHTGYAFDFSIYPPNNNGSTFINKDEYSWIYENCHKYGFVLRYPEGKTAITEISPESWHFRYVGIPHSYYMYQKNKTLEEYLTDISIYTDSIPLTINVSDAESYSVFYVKSSGNAITEFSIPKNTEYKISGDNSGGFIVWYNNADVGKRGATSTDGTAETPADDAQPDNAVTTTV